MAQLPDNYFGQAPFQGLCDRVLFRNLERAVAGETCHSAHVVYRFFQRQLRQEGGTPDAQLKAFVLSRSFYDLWRWFMHLSCISNPNYPEVLRQVLFRRLRAVCENRVTLANLVNDTCCSYFHDDVPTRCDKMFAQNCVSHFVRNDCGNPFSVMEEAIRLGRFEMNGLPTFNAVTLEHHVNQAIEYEW